MSEPFEYISHARLNYKDGYRVISVNVGLPREVVWKGKTVLTGIFKEPVVGRIPARIGDQFRIGTARVVVTQPRFPCYKLGLKFQRDDILKRFLQSGLTGFYLAVLEEGEIAAGDPITLLVRDENAVAVADITRLYTKDKKNLALLQRAVAVKALPESWRESFSEAIARLTQ
jgi:MOSC domain-containing protein YiiM